ncbi:MAG: diaminopimelate epimerase [Bacteroidetes bacterium]|nr:diaminopimelate epimerase [Bacteroidota bacterium]
MTVKFYKYQGTGNDFIMIDNREGLLDRNHPELVRLLCDRRFGIGGDGLIYFQNKSGYDFEMVYFNSDGNESSMCGNGGRCLIRFVKDLGLISSQCRFLAIDGDHNGEILADGDVVLQMMDVPTIESFQNDFVLNTGSPHYVRFVEDVRKLNLVEEARKVRYSPRFEKEGINVNFVTRRSDQEIYVRTYERGVEDETLSCGTGVVASAIAFAVSTIPSLSQIQVETPGGLLSVKLQKAEAGYRNIFLQGPAKKVFEGSVEV